MRTALHRVIGVRDGRFFDEFCEDCDHIVDVHERVDNNAGVGTRTHVWKKVFKEIDPMLIRIQAGRKTAKIWGKWIEKGNGLFAQA
jgi:hypothetical protein